jgi:hypothetical protein
MPNINTPGANHAAPAPSGGWQWLPYTDQAMLHTITQAVRIIDQRIKGSQRCDAAFRALPGGRSFADVWSDPTIWVSYDPDNLGHKFGVTNRVSGTEISITRFALRMGRWTTAATLIHELAHTNGAPGGNSHAAEGTLRDCLLQGLEDPNIVGAIKRASRGEVLV